jgi:hypothetical protein
MKIGPVQSNMPASLIEFCRMQRMISAGDVITGATGGGADAVEISPRAEWMSRLTSMPDVRHDRVASVRAELQNGTYDADKHFDAALDRMINELPLDDLGQRTTYPRRI